MKRCFSITFIYDQESQAIADLDRNSAYLPQRSFLYVVPNVQNL